MKKKTKSQILAAQYAINHPKESITSIAKTYNIDRNALSKLIPEYSKYNIIGTDNNYYYFEDLEKQLIDYFISHPHIKIEELKRLFNLNISSRTLKHWLEIIGYQYKTHFKYSNNRNAFSAINTEEDAYWLGFITADGYINETNKWLNIGLGEVDLEHLKKFLRYMQFTEEEIPQIIKQQFGGAYTRDNIVYTITICGKQLVENLKQYGLFQCKSGKEKPYICATPELEIAYIRGLIDGDGYIRSSQYGLGLVGSQEILQYVRRFLAEQLNWQEYENKYIYPHGTIFKFAIGGKNNTLNILHLLYDNSHIYLNRKFELYRQYCRD